MGALGQVTGCHLLKRRPWLHSCPNFGQRSPCLAGARTHINQTGLAWLLPLVVVQSNTCWNTSRSLGCGREAGHSGWGPPWGWPAAAQWYYPLALQAAPAHPRAPTMQPKQLASHLTQAADSRGGCLVAPAESGGGPCADRRSHLALVRAVGDGILRQCPWAGCHPPGQAARGGNGRET